jgi:hypothetical protein
VKKETNFLEYIPVRNIEWAQDDDGKVYLVRERTKNKFIKKLIDRFNRGQFFYLHLDELGTAAWLAIDGRRTVREICEVMSEQLGEKPEQAEQRLAYFMGMLKKNNFIDFL